MARKLPYVGAFLSAVFLLSGCGLFGPKDVSSPQQIDPPQLTPPSAATSEKVTAPQTGSEQKANKAVHVQKLYVLDADGYVVPWPLQLSQSEGKGTAKQVLGYMVQGGEGEKLLPQGFKPVLPSGTKVLGITIKDGIATVDFSQEFKKYKAEDEQKILDAVTWAMTEFDSVKEVNIRINGHPLEVMPVKGTPVSHLSRETGINVEVAEGVKPGNAMAVTVYFQGQVTDKFTYFVPVTRYVPKADNRGLAAMKELIQGPKQNSMLFSPLLQANVLSVKQQKDTVLVDFDKKLLSYNQGQASPDAMEAIVLSLIENSGAKKVQVMVEGKKNVKAGTIDYSKPVSRTMVEQAQKY
ncbi:GerMN domain-containing protein [Aneurinibacillus uraniidurans]|uniref:GerMN domain-containing protein n=1 Tax=Aneurinibacillus uraniidurans TaxID=2966586 RepID=UPI00234A9703|nr:GerMN domain-containing protein [Aneurinibacillus sp. B1]WCN38513.1 GerMN domain-containing protein [Aneurinibacillus sp. B1]